MELLYRGEFGVHDRDDRARGGAFRGALFAVVLVTGEIGVARGGR